MPEKNPTVAIGVCIVWTSGSITMLPAAGPNDLKKGCNQP